VHDEHGVDEERLAYLADLKSQRRGRVEEYAKEFGADFFPDARPWQVKADLALPCATQNEISQAEARTMIDDGIKAVSEGANMPTEQEGIHDFVKAAFSLPPAKPPTPVAWQYPDWR